METGEAGEVDPLYIVLVFPFLGYHMTANLPSAHSRNQNRATLLQMVIRNFR